jgi:phage terminase small subunit
MSRAPLLLSERERRFVSAFTGPAHGNGTKAAILAGYSARTARVQASQLLTRLNIRAAIQERADQADRKAIASARERDVFLTEVLRDEGLPIEDRIRAAIEMNRCAGRHAARHRPAGQKTLEALWAFEKSEPT